MSTATFGFPIERPAARAERLEETVGALRALFDDERYPGGSVVPAMDGPLVPRPIRSGGPPIWVGGTSDALVRLAGRAADGWNGWGLSVSAFDRKVRSLYGIAADAGGRSVEATWGGIAVVGEDDADAERLAADRAARGHDPAAFTGSAERLRDHLAALASAGATWTIVLLGGPRDRRALVAERVLRAGA